MNDPSSTTEISPLRQRFIDDMNVRRFSREMQRNYIRDVGRFATFLHLPTRGEPHLITRPSYQRHAVRP
jgi:hypothetical protein